MNDNKIIYISIILIWAALFPINILSQTVETFTSSTTWTAPNGVSSVTVKCWGAGGAGGGNSTTTDGGGGGGGGAYSSSIILVTSGNTYTVTVGAGGVGVIGGVGANGEDSWFINASTILAKGGNGGNPPVSGAGGIGGTGGKRRS